MPFLLEVKVDTNDGDYETSTSMIEKNVLDDLMPLLISIAEFVPYTVDKEGLAWKFDSNYPYSPYDDLYPRIDLGEKTPEQLYPHIDKVVFETLNELISCHFFHSIVSVKVYTVSEETILL